MELRRLDEVVEIVTDKVATGKDPAMPYVGLEHIATGAPDLLGTASSASSVSVNSVFARGDTLYGKLRPNLRKAVIAPFGGYCSTDILVLRARGGVHPGYAGRLFHSGGVSAAAVRTAIGTKMPRTSWAALRGLLVHHPPVPEQRRIAEVLDTLDQAVRKTEQLIAKLRQVKQGLLHDLLTRGIDDNGELRDPVRHPEQFTDSRIGILPHQWPIVGLSEIASCRITNGVFKEPARVGAGVPLVNVGDLYGTFGVDLDAVERFSASAVELDRFAVEPGDVLFTRSSLALSGIAHCNVVRRVRERAVFECHLMRVRLNRSRVVPEFVAHWCRSPFARTFLMGRAKQVTMTTISQPDIAPLPVPVPSLGEQRLIAEVLDGHERRMAAEESTMAKLASVKTALMEDLLTGRVRVTGSRASEGTA